MNPLSFIAKDMSSCRGQGPKSNLDLALFATGPVVGQVWSQVANAQEDHVLKTLREMSGVIATEHTELDIATEHIELEHHLPPPPPEIEPHH